MLIHQASVLVCSLVAILDHLHLFLLYLLVVRLLQQLPTLLSFLLSLHRRHVAWLFRWADGWVLVSPGQCHYLRGYLGKEVRACHYRRAHVLFWLVQSSRHTECHRSWPELAQASISPDSAPILCSYLWSQQPFDIILSAHLPSSSDSSGRWGCRTCSIPDRFLPGQEQHIELRPRPSYPAAYQGHPDAPTTVTSEMPWTPTAHSSCSSAQPSHWPYSHWPLWYSSSMLHSDF